MVALLGHPSALMVCSALFGALIGALGVCLVFCLFCRPTRRDQTPNGESSGAAEVAKSSKGRRKAKQEKKKEVIKDTSVSKLFKEDLFDLSSAPSVEEVEPEKQLELPSPALAKSDELAKADDSEHQIPLLAKSASFTDKPIATPNEPVSCMEEGPETPSDWVVATKKEKQPSDSLAKSKVVRLEEECTHYRESYTSLSKLYDEMKKKCDQFEKEKRSISAGFAQRIAHLENDLMAARSTNSTLSHEVATLRQQAKVAELVPELESQLRDSHSVAQQLKRELERLGEIEIQNEEYKAKFKSFEVVAAEYESCKALLSAANTSIESERLIREQSEKQLALLENELASLKSNSFSSSEKEALMQQEITLLSDEKQELAQKIVELQQELAGLRASLEDSMMNAAQSALEKEKISAELTIVEENLRQVQNERENCLREIDQLTETLSTERDRFASEMDLTARAMNAFKQRIRENEAQLSQLKNEIVS